MRKVFVVVLLVLVSVASLALVNEGYESPIVKVVETAGPAVVKVDVEATARYTPDDLFGFDEFFRRFFGEIPEQSRKVVALGSGFIFNKEGYIFTNEHVVAGANKITVSLLDGSVYPAKYIGGDADLDIAVIKIDPDGRDLPIAELGDSDTLRVGEWAIAIGNPLGLKHTVTVGVISAVGRQIPKPDGNSVYSNLIQTDAAINPGNSGGPLLNIYGQVIGINTAIVDPDVGTTLGFAIPVNVALRFVDSTESTARSLGLKIDKGALVMAVVKGSAADKAGIKPQDVIVKFQNLEINNSSELRAAILNYPAGSEVSVVVNRFGETIELKVILGTMQEQVQTKAPQEQKPAESSVLGITVNDITPYDRERLSLPEDLRGVIVSGVNTQGIVYRLGLSIDDVITRISVNGNQQAIQGVDDFKKVVDSLKKGDYIAFFIYRDGVRFVASFQY
jgi:Do/DeqQ family serine protease